MNGDEMKESRDLSVGVVVEAWFLGLVSLCLSVSFLVFNIRLRHTRVIKMSSPNLNVLISCGGILASVGCLMFGMDYFLEHDYSAMSTLCQIRVGAIVLSTSLVFGPMFTKAWRVHRIFQQSISKKVVIRDNKLFVIIGAILLCDVTVLVVWQGVDPLQWRTSVVTNQVTNTSHDVITVHWCTSHNADAWVTALFTFKVIILLYGLHLAWHVRNVSLPSMNDSCSIIITSLTTMTMATFASSVTMMLREWPNAVYACIVFTVWFCNVVAMLTVFLPKVRQWRKTPDNSQFRVSINSGNVTSGLQSFEQVEEELYHMVKENITLQKSLQEKNEDIQVLQKHLDNAQDKLTQIKTTQEGKQDSGLDLSSSASYEDGCDISILHKTHYDADGYESYMDMNATVTQSCRKAARPTSVHSSASVASLSKLAKLRDAVVDDISQANTLSANLRNSISKDMDKVTRRRSWIYNSVRSRQELAGAIAKSYQLEDNCDTYSYVSSYLPSSSSLFHIHHHSHRQCSSDSLNMLANDRLYPDCSKQRREARNQKRHNFTQDGLNGVYTVEHQQDNNEAPYFIERDNQTRSLQTDTFV